MKQIFYATSILSILAILVGVIKFDNFRDRLYLLIMLLLFVAIISGLAYLVKQKQ